MNISEIKRVADRCEENLNLNDMSLSDEHFYQSLPLCIIDAVYSPAAKYPGTRRTVIDYCKRFGLRRIREPKVDSPPPIEEQQSIQQFLGVVSQYSFQDLADLIFHNNQYTHTWENAPLKAKAVVRFAQVLRKYDIDYFQDLATKYNDANLEKELDDIPGQSKDVSIAYFFLLSGSDDFIKADRRVRHFVEESINRVVTTEETQSGLREVVILLKESHPNLTPRFLDHKIWQYDKTHMDEHYFPD